MLTLFIRKCIHHFQTCSNINLSHDHILNYFLFRCSNKSMQESKYIFFTPSCITIHNFFTFCRMCTFNNLNILFSNAFWNDRTKLESSWRNLTRTARLLLIKIVDFTVLWVGGSLSATNIWNLSWIAMKMAVLYFLIFLLMRPSWIFILLSVSVY